MQYLFVAQSLVLVLLLFSFFQLRKAKKRIASNEKNTRNFAASVLEHEERMRLKFTNTIKNILTKNDAPTPASEKKDDPQSAEVFNELAHFATELTPFNPAADTLITAIEKLIETNKRKNLSISFFNDANTGIIPTSTEIIIYRIIKEAITNAEKHSLANKIFISLYSENNTATVTVEDNGTGFDVNKPTSGMGIQAMSKAVAFLNGKIEIQSQRNKGTLLSAAIPVNQ